MRHSDAPTGTPSDTPVRRRPPPGERLAPPELVIDVPAVAAALRQEGPAAGAAAHTHRQMTVLRRGPVRMVVFAFDAGGGLPEHKADGVVAIQVLGGAISVRTPSAQHDLGAGMVLVLDPNTPHNVVATQPTEMLLTVHLSTEQAAVGRMAAQESG